MSAHDKPNRIQTAWVYCKSASWLYPLKGIYYFASHPLLWPLLRARLVPAFLLSVFVLTNLFLWTYLPQVAFLAIFQNRKVALINGLFLVLEEGAALVPLLFEAFLVDETLVDVFDAVLVESGHEQLVSSSRPVDTDQENDSLERLGKPPSSLVYSPFSCRQILEFIIFLPLNFVPYVGTVLFLLLTGYRAGPLHHWRYFKLLGLNKKQRKREIRGRRWQYTAFGTIFLLLQLVPGLSMLFLLTTAAGSALWVCELEHEREQVANEDDGLQERYTDRPF